MKNNESKYIEDENGRFYTERIVLAEEVDFNSKWTLKSILSWMQGMAEKHSDLHGYGFDDLRAKNACWVCLRYHLKFAAFPRVYDKIHTYTWAEPARLGVYPRLFSIDNDAGQTMLRSSSIWSIIDLDTRSMVSPETLGLPPYPSRKSRSFDDLKPLSKIDVPTGEIKTFKYLPVYSDFDMNGHVNNTSYLQWFDDCFSLEDHKEYEVRDLLIHYNHEVLPNIELELSLICKDDQVYFAADSEHGRHFQMLALIDSDLA